MTQQHFLIRENPQNVFIQEADVQDILNKYGVYTPVTNITNFQQAFIHRSYLKSANDPPHRDPSVRVPLQDRCNERLELLGDCILGSVVGTYLFVRFKDQPEGFLTKTKTKIIRGKTLGKLSRRIGFGKWVIISLHVEQMGGRDNIRILEDLFECFIGALYLDNGGHPISDQWFDDLKKIKHLEQELSEFEALMLNASMAHTSQITKYIQMVKSYRSAVDAILGQVNSPNGSNGYLICQKFILNILESEIDLVKLIRLEDNYKDLLQHYFQKNFKGIFPEWEVLKIEGPTTDRWYTVGIKDDRGVLVGKGRARKKLEAEQRASKSALKFLGEEVLSDSEGEEDYYMKETN